MKKIGLLAMVLIFALGGLGVGYAMWDETIDAEVTVKTGSLDVGFSAVCLTFVEGKPVACMENVGISDDRNTATFGICEAYPSMSALINMTVWNYGTTPAHIEKVFFHAKRSGKVGLAIDEDGNFVGTTWPLVYCTQIELVPCTTYYFDLDNDCDADVSLHLKDDGFVCTQIEPTDLAGVGTLGAQSVAGTVNLHVEQGADQLDTYTFDIQVWAVQYNESASWVD